MAVLKKTLPFASQRSALITCLLVGLYLGLPPFPSAFQITCGLRERCRQGKGAARNVETVERARFTLVKKALVHRSEILGDFEFDVLRWTLMRMWSSLLTWWNKHCVLNLLRHILQMAQNTKTQTQMTPNWPKGSGGRYSKCYLSPENSH